MFLGRGEAELRGDDDHIFKDEMTLMNVIPYLMGIDQNEIIVYFRV